MRLIFFLLFMGGAIYWVTNGVTALMSGRLLYCIGCACVAYLCFGISIAIADVDSY